MDRMISDEEIIEIGRKLWTIRKSHNYTQQEFADKLYWDVSSYQKIESGKTLMTLDKAVQIHRKFGVDLNYFIANDPLDEKYLFKNIMLEHPGEESAYVIIGFLESLIEMLSSKTKK